MLYTAIRSGGNSKSNPQKRMMHTRSVRRETVNYFFEKKFPNRNFMLKMQRAERLFNGRSAEMHFKKWVIHCCLWKMLVGLPPTSLCNDSKKKKKKLKRDPSQTARPSFSSVSLLFFETFPLQWIFSARKPSKIPLIIKRQRAEDQTYRMIPLLCPILQQEQWQDIASRFATNDFSNDYRTAPTILSKNTNDFQTSKSLGSKNFHKTKSNIPTNLWKYFENLNLVNLILWYGRYFNPFTTAAHNTTKCEWRDTVAHIILLQNKDSELPTNQRKKKNWISYSHKSHVNMETAAYFEENHSKSLLLVLTRTTSRLATQELIEVRQEKCVSDRFRCLPTVPTISANTRHECIYG